MTKQALLFLLTLAPVTAFSLGCSSSAAVGGARGAGGSDGDGAGGGTAGTHGSLERGGTAGSQGVSGAAGVAGGPAGAGGSAEPSPADISGRWGMFKFEDPVGVQLFEAPDGTLTGTGCAAGAPGFYPSNLYLCGAITGRVTGETATFSFPLEDFPGTTYSTRVTISRDRQRMAGNFNAVAGPVGPMAWLRVRYDAAWLDRPIPIDDDPLSGWYTLDLMADASVGDEFVAGTVYELGYFERSLTGDLGSFWNSETSDPGQGSPLRVGPVPITVPTLPTSLSIDFDAAGFVGVTATTPTGGLYRFSAKKL